MIHVLVAARAVIIVILRRVASIFQVIGLRSRLRLHADRQHVLAARLARLLLLRVVITLADLLDLDLRQIARLRITLLLAILRPALRLVTVHAAAGLIISTTHY